MKTLEVQETTKVLEALEIMNLEVLDKKVVQEVIEKVVNYLTSKEAMIYWLLIFLLKDAYHILVLIFY